MEESEPLDGAVELAPARFNDRLVAFAVDLLIVLLAYNVLTLGTVRLAPGTLMGPIGALWKKGLSLLLFVVYHAVFSCGGRRTAGKAWLGIAVVGPDGQPLSFGAAVGRSLSYLLSTAGLGLGFFWALGSARKAWHDLIWKTTVVETREKTALACTASLVTAWILGPVMAAIAVFILFGAGNLAQMQMVANAQVGLKALVSVNQAYRQANGTYAPDLDTLLKASGHEAEFRENLSQIVDMSTLKLVGSTDSYSLEGVALDEHRTLIKIHNAPVGPPGS